MVLGVMVMALGAGTLGHRRATTQQAVFVQSKTSTHNSGSYRHLAHDITAETGIALRAIALETCQKNIATLKRRSQQQLFPNAVIDAVDSGEQAKHQRLTPKSCHRTPFASAGIVILRRCYQHNTDDHFATNFSTMPNFYAFT